MTTIYVVEDDPSVRKGVGRLLKSAGYSAEMFATAEEFLERGVSSGPGCLVLDVQLPKLNGLDLQRALLGTARLLPIIFISGHSDIPTSVRAMKNGAVDFLPKPFKAQDLLCGIRAALERSCLEHKEKLEADAIRKRLMRLTPREHEVMCGVVAGKMNKQIAAELGVGEKTVKVHRGRVMEKMEADSVAELVLLSERVGVISAPIHNLSGS